MIHDIIYDSIINISFINGVDCVGGECHRSSWRHIVWRCDCMYRINSMAYQENISKKKIGG